MGQPVTKTSNDQTNRGRCSTRPQRLLRGRVNPDRWVGSCNRAGIHGMSITELTGGTIEGCAAAVVRRLRELDPDRITPLEAITLLAALRAEALGEARAASEPPPKKRDPEAPR